VIEEAVEIRTPDGVADGFLFHAEGERNPGVIHLTDIGGIRPAQHDMARKLSGAGFTVLMPNLFYRTGKPPLVQFPIRQSEEVNKRLAELRDPLTPEAVARDASAYVDYLAANAATVEGPMGVVGYCFAGAIAMRIAAARPDRIRAAASFHAGRLFAESSDSPHLLLPKIRAKLYFGHAVEDRSMPKEAIEKFEAALANWGGEFESETYEGAHHSWTVSDSPVYNPAQSQRAFDKLTGLLATLKLNS